MRPSPSELADGLRRTLRDVVAPEVADDYARSQLKLVIAALGQVDWDNAGLDLVRLAGLLETCLPWLDAERDRHDERDVIVALVAEARPHDRAAVPSFADANDLRGRLEAAVERVVVLLRARLTDYS